MKGLVQDDPFASFDETHVLHLTHRRRHFLELKGDGVDRIAVLPPAMVEPSVLESLEETGRLSGVILLDTNAVQENVTDGPPPSEFSPSDTLPYNGGEWNPNGRDVDRRRWHFPMVAVRGTDARRVVSRAQENAQRGRSSFPQSGAGLYFPMGPDSLRTEQCLRDRSCLPLGGQSVWASLGFITRPTVGVVVPLDSAALIHDRAVGGDATVSALVSLMAAARALGQQDTSQWVRTPWFAAFQGEAWGRLGSRFWWNDVRRFHCHRERSGSQSPTGRPMCWSPLRPSLAFRNISAEDMHAVLGIDQVGGAGEQLVTHQTRPGRQNDQELRELLNEVAAAIPSEWGGPISVGKAAGSQIPPRHPLQTIAEGNDVTFASLLLSGYNASFQLPYYSSRFDDRSQVSAAKVAQTATLVARTVFAACLSANDTASAVDAVPAGLGVSENDVSGLLDCFLSDPRCSLFAEILGVSASSMEDRVAAGPLSLYTGVYESPFFRGSRA